MNTTSIFDLSPTEKLQLVEDLWDDLAANPQAIPLHDWQKEELARRKANLFKNSASALVNRVNAAGWCGAKDWRMPTRKELDGLVDLGIPYPGPIIDTAYFPDAKADWHWSGSPNAVNSDYAWNVDFYYGFSYDYYRGNAGAVRLVRGGQ